MADSVAETLIGAAVLAVAGGFLIYAAGNTGAGVGRGGYEVTAEFRKAEGLNVGGDVRIAGVKVGSVTAMELDPASFRASVRLSIDESVKLPDDSVAKIASASLLGENYLAIDPGGSEFMLEPGDAIQFTQDSINLMDMVGRFIHGAAPE